MFLLQGEHVRIEETQHLLVLPFQLSNFGGKPIVGEKLPGNEEVDIGIDPVVGETGDKVVQAIESLGIELATSADGLGVTGELVVHQHFVRRPWGFEMMKTHGVETELGEAGGNRIGVLDTREGGISSNVDAEDPLSSAVAREMSVGRRGHPVGRNGDR